MSQLALTTAGSAVGSYFGGPAGGMIGSMAGATIDQAIAVYQLSARVGRGFAGTATV
jgi:hypothetical protein